MGSDIAVLFERLLPEVLTPLLGRVVGNCVVPAGDEGLHRVCASGSFRGRQIADLLAFCANQCLDGALVVAEADEDRALYFRQGKVVAASSTVYFERIGRVLFQAGSIDRGDMDGLVAAEESMGMAAAAAMLPPAVASWSLERRAWEMAGALAFLRRAHFLVVEGTLELGDIPVFEIDPTHLAMEGLRVYDEWRK